MLWLARPPYLRWLGAALLVAVALYTELRPSRSEPHPFTRQAVAAGSELGVEDVESRLVPAGLLPPVSLPAVAARDIPPGLPLLPTDLGSEASPPQGWWALEVEVPPGTRSGDSVQLVVAEGPGELIPGTVVRITRADDPFEGTSRALVAVPPEGAALAARAVAESRVVVLVSP